MFMALVPSIQPTGSRAVIFCTVILQAWAPWSFLRLTSTGGIIGIIQKKSSNSAQTFPLIHCMLRARAALLELSPLTRRERVPAVRRGCPLRSRSKKL